MKARLISVLLVIALLVTVGVITAQAATNGLSDPANVALNTAADAAQTLDLSAKTCPHCNATEVEWIALTAEDQSLEAGHYYLEDSLEVSGTYSVTGTVCIFLNGKNITATTAVPIFLVDKSTETLNIMGDGIITGAGTSTGSTVVLSSGAINLLGGTIMHANTSYHPTVYLSGGVLKICNNAVITADEGTIGTNVYINNGGNVVMLGGEISNGTAATKAQCSRTNAEWGGNVFIKGSTATSAPSFAMYDGLISGGSAEFGGNIGVAGHFYSATTTGTKAISCRIGGGEIKDGEASSGGNIYVLAKKAVTLRLWKEDENHETPQIHGGHATNGGNIAIATQTKVSGAYEKFYTWLRGVDIYDGEAKEMGGNVYVAGATQGNVEIGYGSGETNISNGKAKDGGNLYLDTGAKARIYANSSLLGGTASSSGGSIFSKGTLTVAGTVSQDAEGNKPTAGSGGAIYCAAGTTTLNDGAVIENGVADAHHGGNVYVLGGTFKMASGSTVQNGLSEVGDGSCIYARSGSLNLLGGEVKSNVTTTIGTNKRQGAVVLAGTEDKTEDVVTGYYSPVLTLGGDFSISNETPGEGIWYNTFSQIIVKADFTGSVTVRGTACPAYGEQFGKTAFDEAIKERVVLVSAEGEYSGSITLPQRDDAPAMFVAAGEGLLVPNVKVGDAWYTAQEAYDSEEITEFKLLGNATLTVNAEKAAKVDLNGKEITVDGTGTFNGTNSSTSKAGTANLGADVTAPTEMSAVWNEAGYYDVVLPTATATTYHKLVMTMKSISLRTTAAGLYYTSEVETDATLKSQITAAGIFLGVPTKEGDDADKMAARMKKVTSFLETDPDKGGFEDGDFAHANVSTEGNFNWEEKAITSVLVKNIFKTDDTTNAARGRLSIVGTPYVIVDADTVLTSQIHVACSMKDYMEKANTQLATDNATLYRLQQFLGDYNLTAEDLTGWKLDKIWGATVPSTEPDATV